MPSNRTLRSRIEGGMLGLLVGDALGVPYEFKLPSELPHVDRIEMSPPEGFPRAHPGVPPGTWSDDGAQALALLASLVEHDRLELDDLARRLLAWRERGYMTPDDRTFDIGIQTSTALNALERGAAPEASGPSGERHNGNGSLMRVLPLALWHTGSDAELAADAMRQSLVTHGHVRSQLCCALYCLWARHILRDADDAWTHAVESLRSLHAPDSPARLELETEILRDGHDPQGSGYVLDSLHSARWAFEKGEYEVVVKQAIALGRDTDTTACIAGGIAGLRDGVEAIPERWRSALRGTHLVTPLIDALVARHQSSEAP